MVVHLDVANSTFFGASSVTDENPFFQCHVMDVSITGHYVCYARSRKTRAADDDESELNDGGSNPSSFEDQWFCYDDSRVRAVSWQHVAKQNAYLLFYQRIPDESGQQPSRNPHADLHR